MSTKAGETIRQSPKTAKFTQRNFGNCQNSSWFFDFYSTLKNLKKGKRRSNATYCIFCASYTVYGLLTLEIKDFLG
jgi:hypothetical protein